MIFGSIVARVSSYDFDMLMHACLPLRSNGSARYNRHAGNHSRRPAATVTGSLERESHTHSLLTARSDHVRRQDILNLSLDTLTSSLGFLRHSTCLRHHVSLSSRVFVIT